MTTNRARPRSRFLTTGIVRVFAFVFLLLQLAVPLATVQTAVAASGDFSIDFVASAPYSYDHLTGGGAYDDRTVGTTSGDIVESLEGGDFACGDIVTYLAAVSVDNTAGANADEPQTIEMDLSFLMDTTGQSGVAIGDIVLVETNEAPVQDLIAGEDTIDQGMIVDPSGTPSTATLKNEWMVGQMFQPGGVLWGTVELTGLDAGEQIIVRIDVKLFCQPGSDPTGNLQAGLMAARLTAIKGGTAVTPPAAIPGGAQTIPFKQFGNIAMPAIDVQKTVTTADGTCPGLESLDVISGDTVKYCYAVTDTGDAPLYDLALVDDNRTPADPGDDFAVTLTSGLTDIDGDGQMDDLAAGATASGTALVTITGAPGAYTNTVTATGYDAILYPTAYTDTDTASVVILFVPMPSIDVEKYVSVDGGASWEDADAAPGPNLPEGSDPQFKFVVTNTGNVELGSISLADSDFNSLLSGCTIPTTLAIGASFNCVITAPWAMGQHTDTATASGSYGGNAYNDTDDANYTGQDVAPTVDLTKTADPLTLPEPGGDFVFTLTIENTSAEDVTITALTDSNLDPLPAACTDLIGDVLTPGQTVSCSYTVSHTEVGSYPNTASVTVVDNEGTTASDSDDETVTVTDVAPTITVDKTADPTSMPEPGGMVTFTVVVTNTSVEAVTLTSLADDIYGNLDGQGTCAIGGTIAAGASYFCSFEGAVTGEPGFYTDVVTAIATDNDGSTGTDFDDATVELTDVAPAVDLTKDVMPSSLPEPGGVFTYTLTITNNSVENVTITALGDTNVLSAECQALVGTSLAAGASTSCTYTVTQTEAGTYPNTADVTVADNDGTTTSDTDSETVSVTDVMPTVELTKSADPTSLPEPGGDFLFTLSIHNTSVEAVTITALTDTNALSAECLALVGTPIPAGDTVSCTYTVSHTDAGSYDNTASVTVADNEGNPASDSDTATVTVTNVMPDISITKTADPTSVPETGGDVTFTFVVTNDGFEDVTLTSLTDSVFGDLNGQGDCAIGGVIPVGGSYSCSITVWLEADDLTAHTNVVTAVGTDDDGTSDTATDHETVNFSDVLPDISVTKTADPILVPETGGWVTFTYVVTNNGLEDVTITSLSDSVYGPLAGDDDCQVGTVLPGSAESMLAMAIIPSGQCEFSITEWVEGDYSGPDHVNIFTAIAEDNDGNADDATDDATVDFENVMPTIMVEKTADPTAVPETGGTVTFTYVVTNTSSEEPVTITSLADDIYGALAGDDDCAVGTVLAAGASCDFAISQWVEGDFTGPDHVNVFTAHAVDNDGTDATDDDDATVDFTNVAPAIMVEKTADPISVSETGGDVTFTFRVTNISTEEPVTITSLSDSVYGLLAGNDDCKVGTVLAAGAWCEFTLTVWVEGDYSGPDHHNVFTAVAEDNDGTDATDDDDATVDFENVLPAIEVTKTANPTAVPETGGDVTFTFVVKNTSSEEPVTITSLADSVYGTLAGDADCAVNTALAAGASCEFAITRWVEGDFTGPDHVNVFTAKAIDNDNTEAMDDDDATVDFTDVPPTILVTKTVNPTAVPETGGDVTFTIEVKNTSSEEAVTLIGVVDTVFGPLDVSLFDKAFLLPGETATYSFTEWMAGEPGMPHENVVTVTAEDNDGTDATGSDDADVTYTDVLPDISIAKTANPTSVPETGGNVTFTFLVTNHNAEAVTLTSLSDDVFGDLNGQGTCAVPQPLAGNGGTYTCTITKWIAGDYESGVSHVNTATVVASDNDGNSDTASDDATVTFTDVTASIDVEKYVSIDAGATWVDADSPTGPYPAEGDPVQFKFVVKNTGNVALSGISLTDSDFILAGCTIPSTLAVGASYECVITTTAVTNQHTDTATASGSFTDGAGVTETDTDTDDANYFGMIKGQPSIQIESLSITINSTRTTVSGQFYITDQSTAAKSPDGKLVALKDYGVRWEQKPAKKGVFTAVTPDGNCTYTIVSVDYGQPAGWMPGDPILFDESITIGYTCTFGSTQLIKGGTLKGIAFATIFARPDMEFTYSSTATIPR